MTSVNEKRVAHFGDIRLIEQVEVEGAVLSIDTRALMGDGVLRPPVHASTFLGMDNLIKLRDGINRTIDHLVQR